MKNIQAGVLICSAAIVAGFIIYFLLQILPNIERLSPAEQEEEWFAILFHIPSIFPGLLGFTIFKASYLNRNVLYLYLVTMFLFIVFYSWSFFAPGAVAAGIPVILILWPVNLFLCLYILKQFRKREKVIMG